MFNRNKKPKDAIVPYPNNNKIKPSNGVISTNSTTLPPVKDTNTDILNQMRSTQQITNSEYMVLGMLKEMLLTLNKIEVNTRSSAVSNEFVGRFVSNKFKWF